MTSRNAIDLIRLMGTVCRLLNLRTFPHFTTLQKFLTRISSGFLSQVIHHLAQATLPPDAVVSLVAVDATGFTCDYASDWYCERTGRERKAFMKLSVAVDTERLVLLVFSMSRTPIHEIRQAPAVLRQAYRHVHAPVYVMDKAYDAEAIHQCIVEDLKAEALIPARESSGNVVTGQYRSRAHDLFDPDRYHQRSAVETTFSIMKRKWGGELTARKRTYQRKQMKLKWAVYALERLGILSFLRRMRAFLQSQIITMTTLALIHRHHFSDIVLKVLNFHWLFLFNLDMLKDKQGCLDLIGYRRKEN